MAQITKIKSDFLGLYVNAGGWTASPFYGTIFKEGDEVRTHHFGGSTNAGVTLKTEKFTKKGNFEIWCTSGTMASEHNSLTQSEIKDKYDWYKEHDAKGYELFVNSKHNDDFHAYIDPFYNDTRKYNL